MSSVCALIAHAQLMGLLHSMLCIPLFPLFSHLLAILWDVVLLTTYMLPTYATLLSWPILWDAVVLTRFMSTTLWRLTLGHAYWFLHLFDYYLKYFLITQLFFFPLSYDFLGIVIYPPTINYLFYP